MRVLSRRAATAEAGVTDADQDRSKTDEGKGPQAAAEIGHVGQKHIIFNGVSAHGGAELDSIRASQTEFEAAMAAMVFLHPLHADHAARLSAAHSTRFAYSGRRRLR